MGPNIQYATESIDPVEVRVYPCKDASFVLYEDEGDGYGYENGQYSEIGPSRNEATKTLTVGARQGSYPGMPMTRTFNVVFVSANHGTGVGVTATADQMVAYDGTSATVMAN